MARTSIIIRTYNEEYWIPILLPVLERQTDQDFEIINVDNGSTDRTLELFVSDTISIKKTQIDEYIPGKALNMGAKEASGVYLVFLSAHCIPNAGDWLEKLIAPLENNVVASYGRQIPATSSHPSDKRDLILTFPNQDNLQVKNSFFHNANSAVLRNFWQDHPFDETLSNIEDRIFGKEIIAQGKHIYYTSEASVVHHHGLHQTGNIDRLEGVVRILENERIGVGENRDYIGYLPKILQVTIVSHNNLADFEEHGCDPNLLVITNMEGLKVSSDKCYLKFSYHFKVIDILKLFMNAKEAEEYEFDFVLYRDFRRQTDPKNIDKIIRTASLLGIKSAVLTRSIQNHVIFDNGYKKSLIGDYFRESNFKLYEMDIPAGFIMHKSLRSTRERKIFEEVQIVEID